MLGEVHSVKICFAYLLLSCSFWSRGLDKLSQTQLPEREAFELSVEKSAYFMTGCCKVYPFYRHSISVELLDSMIDHLLKHD